jgi:hypothetical protein
MLLGGALPPSGRCGQGHDTVSGTYRVPQQARNLLMKLADHADSVKFLIQDPDATYTGAFDAVLAAVGIQVIKSLGPEATGERYR